MSLPPICRDIEYLAREFPGIRISLSVKPSPIIRDMLARHQIDLGIISSEPFTGPSLQAESLCRDDLILICSPDHPLAKTNSARADHSHSLCLAWNRIQHETADGPVAYAMVCI